MRPPWSQPPWFDIPGRRVAFIRELRALGYSRLGGSKTPNSGFVVSLLLHPDGIPERRVTIQFLPRSPLIPRVHVDGPAESPHRYADGTLCMWHPDDSPPAIWAPSAGAADLVTRIAVHLLKEEWFRRTGEWIGDEVQHHRRDDANDPEQQ